MRARTWAGELAKDEMSSWRDAAMGSSQQAVAKLQKKAVAALKAALA